jgi:hypothetical protein
VFNLKFYSQGCNRWHATLTFPISWQDTALQFWSQVKRAFLFYDGLQFDPKNFNENVNQPQEVDLFIPKIWHYSNFQTWEGKEKIAIIEEADWGKDGRLRSGRS